MLSHLVISVFRALGSFDGHAANMRNHWRNHEISDAGHVNVRLNCRYLARNGRTPSVASHNVVGPVGATEPFGAEPSETVQCQRAMVPVLGGLIVWSSQALRPSKGYGAGPLRPVELPSAVLKDLRTPSQSKSRSWNKYIIIQSQCHVD